MWGVLPSRTLHHLFPFQTELEISPAQAEELISLLEKRAWWLITEYLADCEHSEFQCRAYLKRNSFHPEITEKCIAVCKEKAYLDDYRFAEIYIRSMLERGKSKLSILQKLAEHRIDKSVVNQILDEQADPDQHLIQLKEQIARLLWRYRTEDPRKAKEKVYASLYRKGFSLDDIGEAWRGVHSEG